MIIQGLITFTTGIALFLINLLPVANSVTLDDISNFSTGFKNVLVSANYIFPIDTLLTFLGIVFTCEAVVFSFKLYRWIATLVSGGLIKAH
jgi:hypothetical protein